MKHFILISLFLCIGVSAQVWAQPLRDIPYGEIERQKLDVYTFDDAHNAPVMVFVHGGGWHIGSKEGGIHKKPKAFNDAGFVFVSVGYPLLPDYAVGTQADSVARAVSWVSKNIKSHGGDPNNIHLMGHSAGAHLVALVASDVKYLKNYNTQMKSIKTVTSVDGAALNVPWRMENISDSGRFARRMYQKTFGINPEKWEQYSPYHHLDEDAYIPDFLFLTAAERTESNIVSENFASTLRSWGKTAQVVPVENRNHASINRRMGEVGDPAFAAIVNFINK